MVSHWIFFLCYTCFGTAPSIVSKCLTARECATNCQAGRRKERGKSTLEGNQENQDEIFAQAILSDDDF